MRILFVNYEYPPLGGGGGVINKLIAEELAKQHDVAILTSQGMGRPRETVENNVKVYRVPVFFRSRQAAANMPSMLAFLPSGYRTGRQLLKESSFDVINTHFVVPTGPVGDWLSNYASVPNVLSVHGGDLYDPSKWTSPHRHSLLRNLVKKLLRKADKVVGQSSNTLQNVKEYYDADLACDCIPLGIVRPTDTTVAPRERYHLQEDDIVLATVGRLVSRKAVDKLINVVKNLNNQKVHLFIIGSGPQEESLKQVSAELNLAKQIHFLGQTDEKEKFEVLRMADIYASTSQHEGFGIVYLEGMACGLPIVCYDYGGQTDFLTSGETGYLVKLNDLDAFTTSCQNLIDDADFRKKMGKQNQIAVEAYYIDHCAKRYEEVFQQAIDNRKKDI
ncbi:MAG: glycosyltransferase family 4 protein [Thiohalomonadales bacterium]